ncbi:hypothetical protein [Herminiimonas sp. CN]|uniref:hypothetical protein n=1 Tax=Herminiimonas sp. CN TaxID=1349818 RepID=UPI000473CF27|nr:hypothetical protein [Herminiimonas sp. CN]
MLTNIGKKLIGDGAETYLPFALSKLRYFASVPQLFPFSRTIQADEATILLELQSADAGQVTIWVQGFGYEFVSTGGTWVPGSIAGFDMLCGSAVRMNKKFKASAAGSTSEDSPDGSWESSYVPDDMAKFMPHRGMWQIQNLVEHAYFGSVDGKLDTSRMLTDSWSSSTDTTNLLVNSIALDYVRSYDLTYDIAPGLFEKGAKRPIGDIGLAPDSDWYKRAAMRTVVHPEYGRRVFLIMSDVTNMFHAYPIGATDKELLADPLYADQLIKTQVPEKYVKRQQAPLPVWARRSPTESARDFTHRLGKDSEGWGQYLYQYPQYRWAFNSTATRAASVVYRDYQTPRIMEPGHLDELVSSAHGSAFGPVEFLIQEALPGLMELSIELAITGPNLEDFSFSVAVSRTVDPHETNSYIVAADYSWGKRPGGEEYGAMLDDLIIMTADAYPFTSSYPVPGYIAANEQVVVSIKNLTAGTTIKQLTTFKMVRDSGGSLIPTPINSADPAIANYHSQIYSMRILSYDLRVMALMTESWYEKKHREFDGAVHNVTDFIKKLDVTIYGTADPSLYLGDDMALAAEMDTFSVVDLTGMTWLPPNDTGVLTDNGSSIGRFRYAAVTTPQAEFRTSYYRPDRSIPPQAIYNTGAVWYGVRALGCFASSDFSAFTVHPEGHWSVVSPLVVAYPGQQDWVNSAVHTPLDPMNVKQGFVDTISLNIRQSDGTYEDVRAAHLDLYNSAYGRSVTQEDLFYLCQLAAGKLHLQHPFNATDSYLFAASVNIGQNVVLTDKGARVSNIVRGSSMFFGQLNKDKKATP